jgi:hypothetical protein
MLHADNTAGTTAAGTSRYVSALQRCTGLATQQSQPTHGSLAHMSALFDQNRCAPCNGACGRRCCCHILTHSRPLITFHDCQRAQVTNTVKAHSQEAHTPPCMSHIGLVSGIFNHTLQEPTMGCTTPLSSKRKQGSNPWPARWAAQRADALSYTKLAYLPALAWILQTATEKLCHPLHTVSL